MSEPKHINYDPSAHLFPLVLKAWENRLEGMTYEELKELTFENGEVSPVFKVDTLRRKWYAEYMKRGGVLTEEIRKVLTNNA